MTYSAQLIGYWKQVPSAIRKFMVRGLFLFVLWKTAYVLWIGPKGDWNERLTQATGKYTAGMMNFLSNTTQFAAIKENTSLNPGEETQFGSDSKSTLFYDRVPILYIFDSCNGLELLVLYAGFILCYPARWWKKGLFLLAGLPLLFYINVARCTALGYVMLLRPEFLDFAHHYLFKILVYLSILLLWWLFTLHPLNSNTNKQSGALA